MKKCLAFTLCVLALLSFAACAAAEEKKESGRKDLKIDGAPADPNAGRPETGQGAVATSPAEGISVDVQTGKGIDGGYLIGEEMLIKFSASRDCYVTIIDVGTSGNSSVLFPNEFAKDNFVKKGDIHTLPPKGAKYSMVAEPPAGSEHVLAVASVKNIDFKPYLGELTAVAKKTVLAKDLKIDAPDPGEATTSAASGASTTSAASGASTTSAASGAAETTFKPDVFQGFVAAVAAKENVEAGRDIASAACRVRIIEKGGGEKK